MQSYSGTIQSIENIDLIYMYFNFVSVVRSNMCIEYVQALRSITWHLIFIFTCTLSLRFSAAGTGPCALEATFLFEAKEQ